MAREHQQAAVAGLGQRALTGLDLSALLDETVVLLAQVLKVEYCKVLQLLPDGGAFLLQSGVGWKEGYVGHATVGAEAESQAGYTLLYDEHVVVEDLSKETRFSAPPLLAEHGVISGMSVIIQGPDRPYGVLGVHTTSRRMFSEDDTHFLQAVANVLGEAIQRKRAEEALRLQSEILQNITEAVYLIRASDGVIVYTNPSFERLFGYGPGELIGTHVSVLNAPTKKSPEKTAREIIAALDRTGVWRGEILNIKKDGTPFWCAANVSTFDHPTHGSVWVTYHTDITERKRAEEALRESEERYRALYTKTPTMLYSIDTAGRVLAVNDRWLEVFGYERNEVIGRKVVGFLTDDSRRFAETVGGPRFWKAGSVRDVPYQFVKKSGDLVDILLSAVVERDGAGNAVSSLAVLDDVTDRNRLEEALQRAREELEGKIERQMVQRNPYRLTFREFTILHLVSTGRADKEIASELVISPLTVHKHVANILAKMDAASRTEAGVRALREGWLD